MTNKELLEKAQREYYEGVEFISTLSGNRYTVPKYPVFFYDEDIQAIRVSDGNKHVPAVYHNNQWAEIISKPEKSTTLEKQDTPMEIDPRYKEIYSEIDKDSIGDYFNRELFIAFNAQQRYYSQEMEFMQGEIDRLKELNEDLFYEARGFEAQPDQQPEPDPEEIVNCWRCDTQKQYKLMPSGFCSDECFDNALPF